jgi:hypothetical protein
MPLGPAIPALPVRAIDPAVGCYTARFGFTTVFVDGDFAVLARDASILHLWQADDTGWVERPDLAARPVRSGAESFLAGTASCRIQVDDPAELEQLFVEYAATGVLHQVNPSAPTTTDFGTREFATLDIDGNLLTFFVWLPAG